MITDYVETLSRDVIAQRSRVAGLRERYGRLVEDGDNGMAAITRGQISNETGRLLGLEYALNLAEGYVSDYLDELERSYG